MQRQIVFLDRDGTVNVERDYLASVEGMALLPGAAEGIRTLNRLGCPVIIVSNQTVIGRGDCSLETLAAINQRMIELLAHEGASVNGIHYCPHLPDEGCTCRKPKTGLLEKTARELDADLTESFLVGDKCSDIQAGLTVGATTFLVRTGYGRKTEQSGGCNPHYIVDDLRAAAERISAIIQESAMSPLQLVQKHLAESAAVKLQFADSDAIPVVVEAARKLAACVTSGGKIMLCGNGGSAADSQHIAAELTNRLQPSVERPGIPAIALTTDTSFLTARANDHGFDDVFERLVDTLGRSGDALIGISTSGTSRNVIRAVTRAREKQILTVGLLGGTGGLLSQLVDLAIIVPAASVQYIQEAHISIGHILCELVEETLYGTLKPGRTQAPATEVLER